MATIKAYTDLSQSKVLSKILPPESADMFWQSNLNSSDRQYLLNRGRKEYFNIEINLEQYSIGDYDIPAWSLAALLNILPEIQGSKPIITLDDNYITYPQIGDLHTKADNLVDACYKLVLKLHECEIL